MTQLILLYLLRIIMCDVPLGVAKSPHPQALHMKYCARVHQQLAIVGLRDRTLGVPE